MRAKSKEKRRLCQSHEGNYSVGGRRGRYQLMRSLRPLSDWNCKNGYIGGKKKDRVHRRGDAARKGAKRG